VLVQAMYEGMLLCSRCDTGDLLRGDQVDIGWTLSRVPRPEEHHSAGLVADAGKLGNLGRLGPIWQT
jgi:hypothetical protein